MSSNDEETTTVADEDTSFRHKVKQRFKDPSQVC